MLLLVHERVLVWCLLAVVPLVIDVGGPLLAERWQGGTPWNPVCVRARRRAVGAGDGPVHRDPLAAYILSLYALYWLLAPVFQRLHAWLLLATVGVLTTAVGLAYAGLPLAWSLLVLALAPWVSVVGYEVAGHAHKEALIREAGQIDCRAPDDRCSRVAAK